MRETSDPAICELGTHAVYALRRSASYAGDDKKVY